MKLITPEYYKEFHCITSECKNNCCLGGWEIDIDDETYAYYEKLEGEIGDKLRNSITVNEYNEHCFKLENGHCAMLDCNGLCRVHSEIGEEHLGVICNQFPRFSEYYGKTKESGLGLACEEAERIIFSEDRTFSLAESEINEEYEDLEFDSRLYEILFRARQNIFRLLDMKEKSTNEKLIIILDYCDGMQKIINCLEEDEDNYYKLSEYVDNYRSYDIIKKRDNVSISLKDGIRMIITAYEEMEILNEDWKIVLSDVIKSLHNAMTDSDYTNLNRDFKAYINDREYEYKNFLLYLVFRYFLKSVYDDNVIGKARLLVSNYLMLKEIDKLRWLNNKSFSFQDRIDDVNIFSRQVEYSEDNIEILYDAFIFDEIYETQSLIDLLSLDRHKDVNE